LDQARNRLERAKLRLELLDPALVLQRGYVWLSDEKGQTISRVSQTRPGQAVHATLVDGGVDLVVQSRQLN
jgi:exodeoxyribonuclease VII large subunit